MRRLRLILALPLLALPNLMLCGCEHAAVSEELVVVRVPALQGNLVSSAPTTSSPADPGAPVEPSASAAKPQAAEPEAPKPDPATLPRLRLTFDNLKFEMEKGGKFERSMLTPKIEGYMGRKVRIPGFILPTSYQTLTQFVIMRDNLECCFGPGAMLYDCIHVVMQPGKTAEFTTRMVYVEGILSLKIMLNPLDGEVEAIYHLDGIAAE